MSLNAQLESWARWVHRGGVIRPQTSMLGQLIDNKGVMNYSSGGSKPLDTESIEADIEAALMRYAVNHPNAVIVLRVDFGVIRHPALSALAKPAEKALAMGISLRTYQKYLSKVKAYLTTELRL